MTLVKLLLHSIPAGAGFALLLALLVFYLNPAVPLSAATLATTFWPLAVVHGVAVALLWPTAWMVIRFFTHRPLAPRWVDPPLLLGFHLLNSAVAAAAWWGSYLATPEILEETPRRLLLAACGLVTLATGLGLLLLRRPSRRRPAARAAGALALLLPYVLLPALRLRLPAGEGGGRAAASPVAEARPERRVVLVGVEGLSLDLILPLVAEGRLPTFRRLLREGSWSRVQPAQPPVPPAIWTTVATGVLPRRHGVVDYVRFRVAGSEMSFGLGPRRLFFRRLPALGVLVAERVGGAQRRVDAAWNILAANGLPSVVVGWWAAEPGEERLATVIPAGAVRPPGPSADHRRRVEARVGRLAEWPAGPEGEALRRVATAAVDADLAALRQASWLRVDRPAALLVHLPGLDMVQHRFLGHAFDAGSDSPYREVVARYYRFLDEALAGLLPQGGDGPELLLVASAFGVDRAPPWTVLVRALTGAPAGEGYHERRPSGALLAFGPGAAADREVPPVTPADVLPTVLYYLGLPLPRELDGRPRTDLFDADFTEGQPLLYLPVPRVPR